MTIDDALKNLHLTPEERERIKLEEEKRILEEKLKLENPENEVKIEDLESKIQVPIDKQMPKHLRNEYRVRDGNQTVLYVGEAENIHMVIVGIYGRIKLTRYNQVGYIERKLRITRIFPLKLEIKKIASLKNKKIWSIDTGSTSLNLIGRPVRLEDNVGYKYDLVKGAKKYNLKLSQKLFDEVFRPIDKKITEMYKQINP